MAFFFYCVFLAFGLPAIFALILYPTTKLYCRTYARFFPQSFAQRSADRVRQQYDFQCRKIDEQLQNGTLDHTEAGRLKDKAKQKMLKALNELRGE